NDGLAVPRIDHASSRVVVRVLRPQSLARVHLPQVDRTAALVFDGVIPVEVGAGADGQGFAVGRKGGRLHPLSAHEGTKRVRAGHVKDVDEGAVPTGQAFAVRRKGQTSVSRHF